MSSHFSEISESCCYIILFNFYVFFSEGRSSHLPSGPRGNSSSSTIGGDSRLPAGDQLDPLEDEDDMVAADLDMHSLILSSNPIENSVMQTKRRKLDFLRLSVFLTYI